MNALRSLIVLSVAYLLAGAPAFAAGDCCAASTDKPAMKSGCCSAGAEAASEKPACCEGFETPQTDPAPSETSESAEPSGHGGHGESGGGMGRHGGKDGHHAVMQGARTLIFNHESITRTVEEIPNGVRTVTTTSNPDLVATVRSHPREMDSFYSGGGSVRHMDPLFVELAKHHDQIRMEFKDLENGIEVTSTSENAEVVKLIRAHAAKVSEFVARGHAAMRELTPLPDDYTPSE